MLQGWHFCAFKMFTLRTSFTRRSAVGVDIRDASTKSNTPSLAMELPTVLSRREGTIVSMSTIELPKVRAKRELKACLLVQQFCRKLLAKQKVLQLQERLAYEAAAAEAMKPIEAVQAGSVVHVIAETQISSWTNKLIRSLSLRHLLRRQSTGSSSLNEASSSFHDLSAFNMPSNAVARRSSRVELTQARPTPPTHVHMRKQRTCTRTSHTDRHTQTQRLQ